MRQDGTSRPRYSNLNSELGYWRTPARVAARMFEVVEKLGKKGLSWEEAEENLEMWHQVLAEDNPNWK